MLPVWHDVWTVTRTGNVTPLVICEYCESEFVYTMTVEAQSEETAAYSINSRGALLRAREKSKKLLQEVKAKAYMPVACPKCKKYQRYMHEKAAYLATGASDLYLKIGIALPLIAGLIAFLTLNLTHTPEQVVYFVLMVTVLLSMLVAIFMYILQTQRMKHFDPDRMPMPHSVLATLPQAVLKFELLEECERGNAARLRDYLHGAADPNNDLTFTARLLFDVWLEPHELSDTIPIYHTVSGVKITLIPDLEKADGGVIDFQDHANPGLPQFSARVGVFAATVRTRRYRATHSDA